MNESSLNISNIKSNCNTLQRNFDIKILKHHQNIHHDTSISRNKFINPTGFGDISLENTYYMTDYEVIISSTCEKLWLTGKNSINVEKSCMKNIRFLYFAKESSFPDAKDTDIQQLARKFVIQHNNI